MTHRHALPRLNIVMAIVGLVSLSACGQAPSATPPPSTAPLSTTCNLLTLAEVRAALPAADRAEPIKSPDGLGGGDPNAKTDCEWRSGPKGIVELGVRRWATDGSSAMEELKGLGIGFADPMRPDAEGALRFEALRGIGDEAAVLAEQADAARGIVTSGALLVFKKGDQIVMLGISLRSGAVDRAGVIARLSTLGRAAAKRL